MDSDGQIDPADFPRLWEAREEAEMVVGNRTPRRDPFGRRVLSRAFYIPYRVLFRVPLRDPSCSMMLMDRESVRRLIPAEIGMNEGFWWEYRARAWASGYRIVQVPINHRRRKAGVTQVYRPGKLFGIGWRHFAAMARLRSELSGRRTGPGSLPEPG